MSASVRPTGGGGPPTQVDESTRVRGGNATGLVLRVVAPGTILSFPVPRSGTVCIGRGQDADIRIPMPDISRRQVMLTWHDGLAVTDLGSSNGTVVRGQKLVPGKAAPLALREPFLVADAALVVHEGAPSDGPRRVIGLEAFESALNAQLATFARDKRPFGVCSIDIDSEGAWMDLVAALLARTDTACILNETSARLLLLDRSVEQLTVITDFLQRALAEFSPSRRVVLRACPRDGDTITSLHHAPKPRVTTHESRETRRPPAPLVQSEAMKKIYALIDEVAHTATSLLLLGETGVGKDVLARAIHQRSDRANGPMVGLNCAALPEMLLESELFGHERGAFTGAVASKPGLIESADGGTVFLDEVGEMPLPTQAKLLRVLEERRVLRVGGLKPKPVDFRLVSATNRNLRAEIAAGRFRADLFYRLNGLTISIPALRERRDEIIPLADHFAQRAAATLGRPIPFFAPDVLACLEAYSWPGNIRELKSVVERAVLLARAGTVLVDHLSEEIAGAPLSSGTAEVPTTTRLPRLPSLADDDDDDDDDFATPGPVSPPMSRRFAVAPPPDSGTTPSPSSAPVSLKQELEVLEHERILAALKEYGGNQTRAARALGMTRRALIVRLERYGVPRPRKA